MKSIYKRGKDSKTAQNHPQTYKWGFPEMKNSIGSIVSEILPNIFKKRQTYKH